MDVALQMLEEKMGCLPVVEGDQLIGILTEADFVHFFVDETRLDELGDPLAQSAPNLDADSARSHEGETVRQGEEALGVIGGD